MSDNAPKSLILCVHAHQPIGNFDNVFAEGFDRSYRPFFEVLEKHPAILVSAHFSGCLLDWIEKNRPEFILKLKKLHERRQLEFIGGAYYEPIYGLIPRNDLLGQISYMQERLKQLFGADVQGAWLTERVWDPDLVGTLKKASVQFTILDDLHFEMAGIDAPVTGLYQASQGKNSVDLFSTMKDLRYLMPFRKPEETLAFIHATPAKPSDVFVFADDCEKFGMWPGTFDWVYTQGWLDTLFQLLEKDETIRLYSFREYREQFKPKAVLKIPHASYSEMMEWSGGRFYNFLDRYPESRFMRDRMWEISERLAKLSAGNGNADKVAKAHQALYKAQCNCSYWHGVFGGLYLHHLRSAVFENLIQAEHWIDAASSGHRTRGSQKTQGQPEFAERHLESGMRWQIKQKAINSLFNPKYGAAMEELDVLSKSVNILCNLQRHKEPYHDAVLKKHDPNSAEAAQPLSIHQMLGTKEKDLEKHLHYDLNRRLSFVDHFVAEPVSAEQFAQSSYVEAGDFVDGSYKGSVKKVKGVSQLCFQRKGVVRLNGKPYALEVKKTVSPKSASGLEVRYSIKNPGKQAVQFHFGVEFNFSIGENQARNGLNEKAVSEWSFHDSWWGFRIHLVSSSPVDLLASPVETVSESESGLERTYQELGILLQKPLSLRPGQTLEHHIELSVS